nr:hypothetical protein [uncultured Draconibacterium sp.]
MNTFVSGDHSLYFSIPSFTHMFNLDHKKKEKLRELLEREADEGFIGPLKSVNFLLNQFLASKEAKKFDQKFITDVVFDATSLMTTRAELSDIFNNT